MSTDPRADAVRAATALALAVAQPLSTRLARWTGRGTPEVEQAAATEGPVTPAGGAFVIWAPLFAGSLAHASAEAGRVRAGLPSAGAAGWWANAALAGNVAWSLNSQFRRLDEVSVALILGSAAAATTAAALAERGRAGPASTGLARSFGPLAGWLCVAGVANVETTLNLRRGRPRDAAAEERRAVLLVATASAIGSAATVAVRGNPLFTLAAGWGLGGIAVKALRHRRTPVAIAAGLAGLALAAAGAGARASALR
ncbi:hypothetical protein [Pseudonocardia humida]|uniref:TspO/MBR related protein n=1 Tax=Pseudonocardia humida TaxID=2800819 RepID=A0ABT1A3P8_9PSEU|nr:hypothetical protein [Pseudonocardia humida]MCO1657608.1 hypothetical protein [Pseudonocardia humida]